MARDVVVLYSGGVDSTVCAELARIQKRLAHLLHVQYGQANAEMELVTSGRWARSHGLVRTIVEGAIRAPELHAGIGAEGARYVPGRNLALLSLAANFAASHGCREVWIGCNRDDAADYPDCRDTFISAVSALTEMSAGVTVRAPLLIRGKGDVMTLASVLQIDLADTWSCYEPRRDGTPCGTCNACRLRNQTP